MYTSGYTRNLLSLILKLSSLGWRFVVQYLLEINYYAQTLPWCLDVLDIRFNEFKQIFDFAKQALLKLTTRSVINSVSCWCQWELWCLYDICTEVILYSKLCNYVNCVKTIMYLTSSSLICAIKLIKGMSLVQNTLFSNIELRIYIKNCVAIEPIYHSTNVAISLYFSMKS